MLNIMPPPTLQGNEQAQLMQVYRYLLRLSEELNMAMIGTQQQIEQARSSADTAGAVIDEKLEKNLSEQYASLKSLIIKTADVVRVEMDQIVTKLDAKYVAVSEFGTYKEEVSREITETAYETVESFNYGAEISEIRDGMVDFESYKVMTEGYIKRGIIGYEDDIPIIGIAIGRELVAKEIVMVDGVEYDVFDTSVNMATYTSDKLSFWINGIETAYLSNSELNVTRIIVHDSIKLGGWDLNVNGKSDLEIRREIGGSLILESNEAIIGLVGDMEGVASRLEQTAESFTTSINKTNEAVAGVKKDIGNVSSQLEQTAQSFSVSINETNEAVADVEREISSVSSELKQTTESFKVSIGRTNEAVTSVGSDISSVASQFDQTADAFELSLSEKVGEDTLRTYLRYDHGTVEMGSSDSSYKLQASDTGVVILQDGTPMTRMEQNTVAAPVFEAGRMLKIGNHTAKQSASGALVFN